MAKKKKPTAPTASSGTPPPDEPFFGTPTTDEVFAPETEWTPIDLPTHVAQKAAAKAAAKAKGKIKRPAKARSIQEIEAEAWSTGDEPLRPQPKAVTVFPTRPAQAALIQTLPDGAVHSIEPPSGVEGIVVSTSPDPEALTVDHSGMNSAPKAAASVRFGRGPVPSAPMPTQPPAAPAPTATVVTPESGPGEGGPETTIRVEPARMTSVPPAQSRAPDAKPTPEPPKDLSQERPGERGAITIDKETAQAVNDVRREGFIWMRKLKEKVFGSKVADEKDIEARKMLMGLSSRFKNTFDIVSQNQALFGELAKDNAQVREMLKKINDPKLQKVIAKAATGQQMYAEENELLLERWEDILQSLDKIGVSMDVNFSELFKNTRAVVSDSRVDFNTRRAMLANIVKIADDAKINSGALEELRKIDLKNVNFTKEQTEVIGNILERLEPSMAEIKMQGNMKAMNDKMGSLLIDNKKFHDLMEEQVEGQKESFKSLLKKGLGALPDAAKQGLVKSALSAVGLGGLDDILGDFGVGGDALKNGGGKVAGGVGKLLSKIPLLKRIPGVGRLAAMGGEAAATAAAAGPGLWGRLGGLAGKMLPSLGAVGSAASGGAVSAGMATKALSGGGKLLGGAAKLAGKLALPVALGTAAWDTVSGFRDAESITGQKQNSMIAKTGAAVSGLLSGLSFGLFDKKKIYQGLDIIGTGVTETFDGIAGAITQSQTGVWGKIQAALSFMWDGLVGFFKDIGGWIGESFGIDALKKNTTGGEDFDAIAKAQIKGEEGLSLGKYADAHGKSIGYGHFVKPGENIPENITKEYAEQLFDEDYSSIRDFVVQRLKAKLSPEQVASLISFGYNAGSGSVSKVIDKVNAGDMAGAMETMRSTNKSRKTKGGAAEVNPALVARRQREVKQFMRSGSGKAEAVIMDARANGMSRQSFGEQRQSRAQTVALLQAPNQSSQQKGVPFIAKIDDPYLALVNSDLFGR